MADHSPSLTRRTFVKTTGALGALAAAGGVLATSEGVVGETPVATRIHQKLLHGANVM